MRMALIGLAFVTMVLPAGAEPRPWCLDGGEHSPGGGLPFCNFQTLEQCRQSIGGGGEGCSRNTELLWNEREGKRSAQPKRKKSQTRDY
jgi:Protein of unknown function (DUF3551)